MDSLQIKQRLHQLSLRAAQLEGARKTDLARNEQLTESVSQAKGRIALGSEVGRVFEALQTKAHERSVGAFERLLSAILNDVLPEEGVVRLLPQFKNNSTWLDIALEKNGALEDVVEANGGAVTNVVCAGLRFAALSRTNNRRLMVLDEPDCWLKPERVPAFIAVISQVATQTETQTFFITHHSSELLEGSVNIVRFGADKQNKVFAEALEPRVSDWDDDHTPGIRAIELFNVRRHEHTLIPCFPGATAFIGDNNLGKSTAIVSSFKAVAYGESDDTLVRHGAQDAKIIFHLESKKRLEWTRSLKKSPAVMYRFYNGDTLVMEGRPKTRNQAPEWVTEILGVARVDDLDVQVGNQKSPVFLLNDSASRRAQILSVGRESSHLKSFMKKYEEAKSTDREVVNQGELELARIRARLGYLEKSNPLYLRLEGLVNESETLLAELESRENARKLLDRVEQLGDSVSQLKAQWAVVNYLPDMPILEDEKFLSASLNRLERLTIKDEVPAIPVLPTIPVLHDLAVLEKIGSTISKSNVIIKVCSTVPAVIRGEPSVEEVDGIKRIVEVLKSKEEAVNMTASDLTKIQQEEKAQLEAYEDTKKELGECPLCGVAFDENKVHNHA